MDFFEGHNDNSFELVKSCLLNVTQMHLKNI
jgi:hypothetical protein